MLFKHLLSSPRLMGDTVRKTNKEMIGLHCEKYYKRNVHRMLREHSSKPPSSDERVQGRFSEEIT